MYGFPRLTRFLALITLLYPCKRQLLRAVGRRQDQLWSRSCYNDITHPWPPVITMVLTASTSLSTTHTARATDRVYVLHLIHQVLPGYHYRLPLPRTAYHHHSLNHSILTQHHTRQCKEYIVDTVLTSYHYIQHREDYYAKLSNRAYHRGSLAISVRRFVEGGGQPCPEYDYPLRLCTEVTLQASTSSVVQQVLQDVNTDMKGLY